MANHRIDTIATAISRRATRRSVLRAGAGLAVAGGAAGMTVAQAFAQDASPVADGLVIRPNAANLTAEQRKAYVDAVLALKIKPSPWIDGISTYDTFVLWHRDAFNCDINAAHMGSAFLPWHRMFLHLFQQQLQSVDPSVVLPYWDWTVDQGTDSYVWQDDFMGGDGSDADGEAVMTGPFAKGKWEISVFDYTDTDRFTWIVRDLGVGELGPALPTAEEVEQALAIPTYDVAPWSSESIAANSFRNFLEGWRDCVSQTCDADGGMGCHCTGDHLLHNRVHLWVAGEFKFRHEVDMEADMPMASASPEPSDGDMTLGTMAANSSPNDPVFFLHHANIDRIWNLWLARHGQVYLPETGGPAGHNIDDHMWPYEGIGMQVTPRMMLDSRSLGYRYDTDE